MGSTDYEFGYWFGRRDGRYARLFGSVPFVGMAVADVRQWSRANSHKNTRRSDRAYWLGYARGLTG